MAALVNSPNKASSANAATPRQPIQLVDISFAKKLSTAQRIRFLEKNNYTVEKKNYTSRKSGQYFITSPRGDLLKTIKRALQDFELHRLRDKEKNEKIEEMENHIFLLRLKVLNLGRSNREHMDKVKLLQNKLAAKTSECSQLTEELSSYKENMQQKKKEKEDYWVKTITHISLLRSEVMKLRRSNRKHMDNFKYLEKKLAAKTSECSQLTKECSQLTEELSSYKENMQQKLQSAKEKMKKYKTKAQSLRERLKPQVSKLQDQSSKAEHAQEEHILKARDMQARQKKKWYRYKGTLYTDDSDSDYLP